VNAFAATGFGGVYAVSGTDPVRGAYSGQVELRWEGSDYSFVREVEYTSYRHQGRPVSLVWSGRAVDGPASGLRIDLSLQRMNFAGEAEGIAPRTAADGIPMTVQADFAPQGAQAFSGTYRGQGAPFTDPSEHWSYDHPPYVDPIWQLERTTQDSHSAPNRLTKLGLQILFRTYYSTPWIAPYTSHPDFQSWVHRFVYDRTDFALHRARPDLLRLIDTLVDDLNLHEAEIKANAFGKTLAQKAAEADLEVPQTFLEPNAGCLISRSASGAVHDEHDGTLWTGTYCYSQALRYETTQDPAARDNMIRSATSLYTMLKISGRGDDFARTIRTAGQRPLGTTWRPGVAPYTNLEWKIGGNNDMWKGFLLAGLALHDGPGQSMRADFGAALQTLAQTHDVMKGSRRGGNRLITWGTVAALTGDAAAKSEYRKEARNPYLTAFNVAMGGGFHFKGVTDWSGTHLNIVGLLLSRRLAVIHNYWIAKPTTRLALQRAAKGLAKTRRSLHMIVAAGIAPSSSLDTSDAIWAMRELPMPRSQIAVGLTHLPSFSASPIPNLPWKQDWATNQGRARGMEAPPLWVIPQNSYAWKNTPFPRVVSGGRYTALNASSDLLLAYWFGRRYGVISPTD
tara:strand:- start:3415 stop:5283 length:1869 start_codon:yes stop_codon:yes gene_type:complete